MLKISMVIKNITIINIFSCVEHFNWHQEYFLINIYYSRKVLALKLYLLPEKGINTQTK